MLKILSFSFDLNSRSVTHNNLTTALQYLSVSDAYGAGFEMNSREEILANWHNIRHFPLRNGIHCIGVNPGEYTDDTEEAIGLALALNNSETGRLEVDDVIKGRLKVYDDYKLENSGVPRGGYGGFGKFAALSLSIEDRIVEIRKNLQAKLTRKKGPGNGSLMRLSPILFFALDEKHLSIRSEKLLHNIIVQTLASHNHLQALLVNLVYVEVSHALVTEQIPCSEVIRHAINFLSLHKKCEDFILPNISKCMSRWIEISKTENVGIAGEFDLEYEQLMNHLHQIDSLEAPLDAKGTNINLKKLLKTPYPKPCKGGLGLSAKANDTLFAALYCLKFLEEDFNRAEGNVTEGCFGVLTRVLSFGGDTDTLGACVGTIAFYMLDKRNKFSLPDWMMGTMNPELKKLEIRLKKYQLI